MNFLIFWDFSEFILEFKSLKVIKKLIKRGVLFARDPCGCDMARKATWQSHTNPHERLHGAEVTHVHIYIYYILCIWLLYI